MMLTLTEADDGREIELREQDAVEIRLSENAGTGYQWTARAENDCVVVEDAGVDQTRARPGAAGTHEFRVRAAAPGSCVVQLRLGRVWEDRPEREIVVRVRVYQR